MTKWCTARVLLRQMWGDDWQQRAQLRLLLGYQYTQPGKKLLFAGAELGQPNEWDHENRMPMELLADPHHGGIRHGWPIELVLPRPPPRLHATDCVEGGFEWIDADDAAHSTFSFLRSHQGSPVLVVANFTPQPWHNYRVGVPTGGRWTKCSTVTPCHTAAAASATQGVHGDAPRPPAVLPFVGHHGAASGSRCVHPTN